MEKKKGKSMIFESDLAIIKEEARKEERARIIILIDKQFTNRIKPSIRRDITSLINKYNRRR